jgi:hypothetical protein
MQYAELAPDLRKCFDRTIEMSPIVCGRYLDADASCISRHDGKKEADYVNACVE